jgi:hypothetical protein
MRFTLRIDRTFHRPIEFRAHQQSDGMVLRTVVYTGLGGYDRGVVRSDTSRTLTPEEAASVRSAWRAVEDSRPSDLTPNGIRDGSIWTLSGAGTPMRVWSPKHEDELRGTRPLFELGLLLWRCGKIDEPEKDLY